MTSTGHAVATEAARLDPIVPDDLIPAVDTPARPARAPLWKSIGVAVIFFAAIVGLIGGAIAYANTTWSRTKMELTALRGIEALIAGDPEALAAQSTGAVSEALTPSVRERMRTTPGGRIRFSEPRSTGGSVVVEADVDGSLGTLTLRSDESRDVVTFVTTGALGVAHGDLEMVMDLSGWKIGGLHVR